MSGAVNVNVGAILEKGRERLAKEPARLKGQKGVYKGVYEVQVTGAPEPTWHIEIAPKAQVKKGPAPKGARATLTFRTSNDFDRVMRREINGKMAFMAGKFEVKGDLAFAMAFQDLLA